jgi:hypothetical protein
MPTYAMTAASFDLVYNGLSCAPTRRRAQHPPSLWATEFRPL